MRGAYSVLTTKDHALLHTPAFHLAIMDNAKITGTQYAQAPMLRVRVASLVLLTSAEKTKVDSPHAHNIGKVAPFDVSTVLWHAPVPLGAVGDEDNKHS